jgi:ornithine carbamoyltransferase
MKHFLSITDCSADELNELLDLSAKLKEDDKKGSIERTLSGKALALIFEKASLRTRVSFEIAMADLGGVAIYMKPDDIGILGQREPIKDMARVFGRYVHGIMARTFAHDTLIELAEFSGVPVINGLSDFSHPCQAMADMLTIKEHLGRLDGIKIAFIGDGNNVARSLAFASAKLGLKMTIASPAGYELDPQTFTIADGISKASVTRCKKPADAVKGVDVVYTDTWVSMGQEAQEKKRLQAFAGFQVNSDLLQLAPNAKIMHCLPAHRGREITDEVMESANSIIFDQAENRLHFQRALLQKLLGG